MFLSHDCRDAGVRATHGAVAERRKDAKKEIYEFTTIDYNFAIFAPWRELFFLAEVNSCRIASAIVIKFIEFADAIRLYTCSKES